MSMGEETAPTVGAEGADAATRIIPHIDHVPLEPVVHVGVSELAGAFEYVLTPEPPTSVVTHGDDGFPESELVDTPATRHP